MAIYPYSFTLPPVNKQDIPSNGVPGEFLGISAGGVLDWLPVSGGSGTGDLLAANNLSELTPTAGTARTNLGLGTGDSPTFANLTLTSPSLASSAPVTISQTWNNAAVAFNALVVNAAGTSGTNSATASNLLDLQLNTASKFSVNKAGVVRINNGGTLTWNSADNLTISSTSAYQRVLAYSFYASGLGAGIGDTPGASGCTVFMGSGSGLGWLSGATIGVGSVDTILLRDGAANTLALRNGAAAQTFNVYGTYTSAASYARLAISCDTSGNATLITQSTGAAGNLQITGQNELRLGVGSAWQWRVNSSGHFQAGTDNLYDIGASGASRPRNVYVANGLTTGSISPNSGTDLIFNGASTGAAWKITPSGHFHAFADNAYDIGASGANRPRNVFVAQTVRANAFQLNGLSHVYSTVNGNIGLYDNALTAFNLLQFGGTTNLFPAIKRNAAGLDIVLANDSGFAPLAAGAITANLGATVTGGNLQVGGAAEGRSVGIGIPVVATHSLLIGNGGSATRVQLGIQQATGQTGNLFEWINSSSAVMGVITTAGNVGIGTTAPSELLELVKSGDPQLAVNIGFGVYGSLGQTDNTVLDKGIILGNNGKGGVGGYKFKFTTSTYGAKAITLDNTGISFLSAEGSTLANAAFVGPVVLRVIPNGNVGIGTTSPTSKLHVAGDITSDSNIYAGTNGYLFINGRSAIGSFIAGGHTLLDNAGSFYNRLNLGGNTNLFPAIKRVGAELQIVIASTTSAAGVAAPDADMAFIEDRYRRKGAGTPEGVVTAPIGAVYHNTTGGAGTSFYVKESGTGNTGWVGK